MYDTVNHPVHVGIVCLLASHPIQEGEEVYVDYWYVVTIDTEPWYMELYYRTIEEEKEEFGDGV